MQHFTYIKGFFPSFSSSSSFSWAFVVSHFWLEAGHVINTLLCVPLWALLLPTKTKLLIFVSSFGIWSEKQPKAWLPTFLASESSQDTHIYIYTHGLTSTIINLSPLSKRCRNQSLFDTGHSFLLFRDRKPPWTYFNTKQNNFLVPQNYPLKRLKKSDILCLTVFRFWSHPFFVRWLALPFLFPWDDVCSSSRKSSLSERPARVKSSQLHLRKYKFSV